MNHRSTVVGVGAHQRRQIKQRPKVRLRNLALTLDASLLHLQGRQRLGSGLRLFNPNERQRAHYVSPGVTVHSYGRRFNRESLIVDLEVANLIAPNPLRLPGRQYVMGYLITLESIGASVCTDNSLVNFYSLDIRVG
jgi:hypothetical protein